ncbi:MAG: ASKHA domain-containing protein [Chloroflexota bacterium]
MSDHRVIFDQAPEPVNVPTGTLLVEAAREAGVEITQPCGGQGRCGRCIVQVTEGDIRRRSTLRLSTEDVNQGYALACQSVVEGNVTVVVPPQEKVERRLTTDRTVAEVTVPEGYDPNTDQTLLRVNLTLPEPNMEDQRDDWSRIKNGLRQETNIEEIRISFPLLRHIGQVLRRGEWQVTAILERNVWDCPECPTRLIELLPGHTPENAPLWGLAIDIGTTTVTVWLVNLLTGKVQAQVAEYNGQIARGEDIISRIVYASKNGGGEEMRRLVLGTVNQLIETACLRGQAMPQNIYKATIAGNSTMIHLLLGISSESIRLSPFVTTINHIPTLRAQEVGLDIHPEASVDCLPGVASYVGADITAGVLSSGMDDTDKATLFMDVGTNGETVLGSHDWLATCACSAGPAFEGAGVQFGMRATKGAIEEVWINGETYEPSYRVIGNTSPRGVCGSGLISLLAEVFLTGVVDKGGNFNKLLDTPRIRQGEHGWEYVIVWGNETQHGKDIVLTRVDIDNLLRAKAAIYAGFTVLADKVGIPLGTVEQVLIGGAFGKYINVEKAIQIGLFPDMPWDRFSFLGNTSVQGAYRALLDHKARQRIKNIASRMTYIELSADNTFYDAFMSALFLPHTDLTQFPSVEAALDKEGS